MVLSKRVAAFNNRVTNRITGPVAGHLPGFGIVIHTGRKSGREYCLALTPDEQKSDAPFDWHGWQISPAGEVRELDLSKEPAAAVHTNPRSMAVALWNLYVTRF